MAMIKAEVKNLRRVPTAVWVGKKRYVFPANINVRMNLDEAMLSEIQRNPAFSVKVISRTEEPQVEVKASEEAKASEESPKQEAQIETVEDVKAEELPASVSIAEEPVKPVESESVEAEETNEEANDESEEANDEATDDVSHKDLFSMKKDELAAYLASKGVNADGMSRKDMLKAVKRV